MLNSISNLDQKNTQVSLLVQARINLQGRFFVAAQLNDPRLLGMILLYFLIGVSPFACFKAVVLRKRRINCAELAHSCAEARYLASPELFQKENLASACLNQQ